MSEILQGLELQAQAQGNADLAAPVVDMRSARLLPETTGSTDSPHLPLATFNADHIDMSDAPAALIPAKYSLDDDNEQGLGVKGLLTQLLEYPGPVDGIVPDSWGTDERAPFKHVSRLMDSIYALDNSVDRVIDGIRQDILEIRRSHKA